MDPTTRQLVRLVAGNKPSIGNLAASSMWENIQILLNGANVSFVTTTNTHLKAYLETILTFGHDASRRHMTAAGFCMDSGNFNNPKSEGNKARRAWTALSAEVSFSSNIHVDVLSVPRYASCENTVKQLIHS
jgi:hypothetical protein